MPDHLPTHEQIAPLLAVYRDWNEAERRMVMTHVATCPECAAQLARFQAMDKQLRQLPHPKPNLRLAAGFYGGLKQRDAWRKWLLDLTAQLAGAAALLLILFTVWFVFQDKPTPEATPASTPAMSSYDLRPQFTLAAAQGSTILALSHDGQFLATAQDNTIQIWLVPDGRRLRTLVTPTPVSSLAFTPNNLHLFAQSSTDITQWRVNDGELVHTFAAATPPYAVSNEQLALITPDAIELWSIRTGEREQSFAYSAAAITCLLWSHDGETLISGSSAGQVQFRTRKGELLNTWNSTDQPIQNLTLAADGTSLAVQDAAQQVQVWSMAEGEVKQRWAAAAAPILSLVFANDDTSLFLSLADGTAQFYNLDDSSLIATLTGPAMFASAWALTPDNFRLVALTTGHQVQILERPLTANK